MPRSSALRPALCAIVLVVPILALIAAHAAVPNAAADLDGNGIVNTGDLLFARQCVLAGMTGQPLPAACGIADPHPAGGGDGDWDYDDYLEVRANRGQTFATGDVVSPEVAIEAPVAGAILAAQPVKVTGQVDDAHARIELEVVNIEGTRRIDGFNGGATHTFTVYRVPLVAGTNLLRVLATDTDGNVGSHEIQVSLRQPDLQAPTATITSPTPDAMFVAQPIEVRGSIDDPLAAVAVNGVPALVSAGTFTAAGVPLAPGLNLIEVVATDPAGNRGTAVVQVEYQPDRIAPELSVVEPRDGASVDLPAVTVSGFVDDMAALVTVNGIETDLEDGRFQADQVPLVPGANTIVVQGVDPAGNRAETRLVVTYEPPDQAPPLLAVDGDTDRFTERSAIALLGDVSDAGGVAAVVVRAQAFGGAEFAALLDAGRWSVEVPLVIGVNPLRVRAFDRAGNATDLALSVERAGVAEPMEILVDYPTHGSAVAGSPVVVRGTLRTAERALMIGVSVNGIEAVLGPTDEPSNYAFATPPIALVEGLNDLVIVARADEQQLHRVVQVTHLPAQASFDPPEVRMLSPAAGATLSKAVFTLVVEVSSQAGLASLRINGRAVDVPAAKGTFRVSEPLAFAAGAGRRDVLIEAEDHRGQSARLEARFLLDAESPTIRLDQALELAPAINEIQQQPFTLSGSVSDPNLAGFSVAEQAVGLTPAAQAGTFTFAVPVVLAADSEQRLVLQAVDRAGNRARTALILRRDVTLDLRMLSPAADLVLEIEPDGNRLPVTVQVDSGEPIQAEVVLIDAQGEARAQVALTGEAGLLAGSIDITTGPGDYRLEARTLTEDGKVQGRTSRRLTLVEATAEPLALLRSNPVAGAEDAEPNGPLSLFFNQPIDPARITVAVHETAHGQTYVDQDPPGTPATRAKGYRLVRVDRSFEPLAGELSLLPGGRILAFYPDRELAYGAQVFVDVGYDGDLLNRFSYRIRPTPTLLSGSVLDVFGQAVAGVPVEMVELGRRTVTDRNGGFAFGFGDAAGDAIEGGRWVLDLNRGMTFAGYGSRRQWISVARQQLNEIGILRLPALEPDTVPVPATGGWIIDLLSGALRLDLSQAALRFPDERDRGDLHAQFLPFSQLPYPATELAVPHFVYAVHPAGIELSGAFSIDLQVPSRRLGYEHLPPADSYVILVGLDPYRARIVPVGVGQVQGKRVISRGSVALDVLDIIGYAIAAPDQQDALAAFAAGHASLPALLARLRL